MARRGNLFTQTVMFRYKLLFRCGTERANFMLSTDRKKLL